MVFIFFYRVMFVLVIYWNLDLYSVFVLWVWVVNYFSLKLMVIDYLDFDIKGFIEINGFNFIRIFRVFLGVIFIFLTELYFYFWIYKIREDNLNIISGI